MLPSDYSGQDCSLARALEQLGERWSLLIVRDCLYGVCRYNDFLTHLRIPRAVLSARLHTLCAHGVLERHRYQRQPDRYEYLLTAKGRALWPALHALARWGDTHGEADGPARIFEHASCQARLDTDLRCTRCGRVVDITETRTRRSPGRQPADDEDEVTRALAGPRMLLTPLRHPS